MIFIEEGNYYMKQKMRKKRMRLDEDLAYGEKENYYQKQK